jgi:GAF domain-containing protein
MSKVVRLHQSDAMKLPLAGGAALELTPFRDSPHVALSLIGPAGGDRGGVILRAERARRLGSWLLRLADRTEGTAGAEAMGGGDGEDSAPMPVDEESIMALARAAVPVFADWCVIDVVESDGSTRRLAPAHSDPLRTRLADKLQLYPADPKAAHPRSEALRVGTPYVHPQVADASIAALAQSREHLQVMRSLAPRSSLGMPIIARERVLGVMTFVWTDPSHCYDDADVPLARALADQVGIVLDNVQLYRAARARFASELKESIRRRRRPIAPAGGRNS